MNSLKQSYYENAQALEGWQKLTRSQIGYLHTKYKYEEHNEVLADACVSALVYKFWNVIYHNFFNQGQRRIMTFEDCYNYVVDAIMYVLDKHVWTDPTNSLYNDPNAPEKAINVRIVSYRYNFLMHEFRDKRALNTIAFSLDSILSASLGDEHTPKVTYEYNYLSEDIAHVAKLLFEKKQYLRCFVLCYLHNASNGDLQITQDLDTIPKGLINYLKGLQSDKEIKFLSAYLEKSETAVRMAIQSIFFYLDELNADDCVVLNAIKSLQNSEELLQLCHE